MDGDISMSEKSIESKCSTVSSTEKRAENSLPKMYWMKSKWSENWVGMHYIIIPKACHGKRGIGFRNKSKLTESVVKKKSLDRPT